MHGFIYLISNSASDKVYVGQTVRAQVERRWYEHRWALINGRGTNRHLQIAWAHHGQDAFVFSELERVEAVTSAELKALLTAREGYWMAEMRGQGKTLYNAQAAGDSMAYLRRGQPSPKKGVPMSEDQRLKVVASLKGNTRRKGIPTSDQGRANIAASKRGKPSPNKGTTMSAEQRKKLSQAHIGVKLSDEHRAALKAASQGRSWILVNGLRVYSRPGIEGAL